MNALKKELDQLLSERADLLNFVLDEAIDGHCYIDPERPEETWISPKLHQLLGYDPHEEALSGEDFARLLPQKDFETLQKYIAQGLEVEPPLLEITLCYKHKRGHRVWLKSKATKLTQLPAGQHRFFILHFDVSKEFAQHEQLLEQERRFIQSLEELRTDTWEADLQTGVLECSEEGTRLIGYSTTELQPLTLEKWNSFVHPDDLSEVKARLIDCLKGSRDTYEFESRMRHKEGHWVWVYSKGIVSMRDEQGMALRMNGFHQSLTGTRRQEEMLLLSESNKALLASKKEIDASRALAEQKSQLLEAVSVCTALITRADDWLKALEESLRILGEALGADRTYYFKNSVNENGEEVTSQLLEWCREGIPPQIQNKDLQEVVIEGTFAEALHILQTNNSFEAIVSELEHEATRMLFESQGIKTVLFFPVFVDRVFDGLIGFDDCTNERHVSPEERAIMLSFSDVLGNTIQLHTQRQKLEVSENQLRSILDSSKDSNILLGLDFEILKMNKLAISATEAVFGKEPKIGEDYRAYILDAYLDEFTKNYKTACAGEIVEKEFQVPIGDTAYWLSYNFYPTHDESGTVIGVTMNVRDIHSRKTAEQQLKESEAYYRSLVKAVPDLLFIMSNEGVYLDFTADHKDLYLEPGAFLGKHVSEILPKELTKKVLNAIDEARNKREVVQFRYSMRIADQVRHFMARFVAFENGIINSSTDITETVNNLRRIETLLEQKEKQNSRLQNFTHIVSHNLKSHIANLQGLLHLMELEEPETFRSPLVQMLKSTSDNLSETVDHLNEVLDISLTKEENKVEVELKSLVDDVLESVSLLIRDANIQIDNLVTDSTMIRTIAPYLQSIVLNMVTNSIKYRSEERDSFLRIRADERDQHLVLRFEDNGLGIDLKRHGKSLFGMYKTFHTHKESKGLGLFITHNQVSALGGQIEVKSEPDVGTTFIVTLPNGSIEQ